MSRGLTANAIKQDFNSFIKLSCTWIGPRLAPFIAINLFGPEIFSIYRWRNKAMGNFVPGLSEENFRTVRRIYKEAMQRPGVMKSEIFAKTSYTNHDIIQQI